MANLAEVVDPNSASGGSCSPGHLQSAELQSEFSKRRRAVVRARGVGIALVLSLLPLFGILKNNFGIEAGVGAGLVCMTAAMAVRIYAKSIWKCPACSASLRLDRVPDHCFRCGQTDR